MAMKKKTKKKILKVGFFLAGVGGLVHLLAPLGIDVLSIFGNISGIVQFIAGGTTIAVVLNKLL